MKGNVLAASLNGIFLTELIRPTGQLVQDGGPTTFHSVHYFQVLQEEAKDCD